MEGKEGAEGQIAAGTGGWDSDFICTYYTMPTNALCYTFLVVQTLKIVLTANWAKITVKLLLISTKLVVIITKLEGGKLNPIILISNKLDVIIPNFCQLGRMDFPDGGAPVSKE